MKEDLRYLERLMTNEETPLEHPSVEKLAQFSDGTLKENEREEVLAHLVRCEACRDLLVVPKKKKRAGTFLSRAQLQVVNVAAAIAASLILFMFISFPEPESSKLGMVDLSTIFSDTRYKAPVGFSTNKQKIDADAYLKKIVEETDMTAIPAYQKALMLEKKGDLIEARREFKQAYIAIRHNENSDERIRQKIVINYRLLRLSLKEQEKNSAGIKAYRSMLRYDIAVYATHHKEP